MKKEPEITSQQWKEFLEDPVLKEVLAIIKGRRKLIRDRLETGSLKIDTEPILTVMELRGSASSLIWLEEVLTKYEQVLKEKEKVEEEIRRRKEDDSEKV